MPRTGRRRLAVISQLPPPVHGSTLMTAHLLDAMRDLGADVRLVDRRFSRTADEVGRFTAGKVLAVPALAARLVRALRRRPDAVIHFVTNRPGSFLVDALLVQLVRRRGVPLVLYVHTMGFAALAARGGLWRRLVERTLRAGDRIVVLGDRLVQDVVAFAPAAEIRIVPNTAGAIPAAREPQDRDGAEVSVLFLSNLLQEKGVDDFVDVAARLMEREANVPWRFRIAGAGPADRLAEIAGRLARAGLAERTELIGAVDTERKWALLHEAAVLLFPSRYPFEAQPLAIVEALSVGTPVVAFDIGGVGDLVDAEVGALVPAGDRAAMVDAVLALSSDGTLSGAREAAIRDRAARIHSLDAYTSRWSDVLDGLSPLVHRVGGAVDEGFATDLPTFLRLASKDWRAEPAGREVAGDAARVPQLREDPPVTPCAASRTALGNHR